MENIENMPRPEIVMVADAVAREKNIEKEDVLRKPAYAVGNIYYPIMSMLGKY